MENQEDTLEDLSLSPSEEQSVSEDAEKQWKSRPWPSFARENILLAVYSFSKRQKTIFFSLLAFCLIGGIGFLWTLNDHFLVDIPSNGGVLTEGIVGTPRFINPVLAASDTDDDISSLVYSGLMRVSGDGTLIPDLAESYTLSEDGRTYTFVLKSNLVWHDGKPVTSADVKFTIDKVKDSNLRSPSRGNWDGVTVEVVDEKTIKFTLSGAYEPFLENTTLGILPVHLWSNLSAEEFTASPLNMHPVGTGPYKISEEKLLESGVPEYFDLQAFDDFPLGKAHIQTIRLRFYGSEGDLFTAYKKGEVESAGSISSDRIPEIQQRGDRVEKAPLPRVFGVFFDQANQEVFIDTAARKALDKSVNRDKIINTILNGEATAVSGPFPPGSLGWAGDEASLEEANATATPSSNIEEAKHILQSAGWSYSEADGVWEKKGKKDTQQLAFSLSTSDSPELKAAALSLKQDWEALGAKVEVKIFEAGDLNQNIIRPRKYEALLFGEIVGRDPDPYAFWHSSQRLDPGLNIALYANVKTDKLLEKMRETTNLEERQKMYRDFENEIRNDVPAVFLYSPQFLYVLPKTMGGVSLPPITHSSERFSQVYNWYKETERVWKIFAQ